MNIGPGNIEALLLDALEGRLSAADAELVWAALEAHPEWGVSWDFDDRELPRLQAEDVPPMDWSGLKKEVVSDQQIRQALRQDRERHTLDATVKQSLYRREERVLWRYWAAAASVALLVWFVWPTDHSTTTPLVANVINSETNDTTVVAPAISPVRTEEPATAIQKNKASTPKNQERIIIENCTGTPELAEEEMPKHVINPLSPEEMDRAQAVDTTSLEAPLELPFEVTPTFNTALIEEAPRLHSGTAPRLRSETEARTYTPLAWLKMKAGQIAKRAEADGTLPTVHREKESFNMQWGSLSINAH